MMNLRAGLNGEKLYLFGSIDKSRVSNPKNSTSCKVPLVADLKAKRLGKNNSFLCYKFFVLFSLPVLLSPATSSTV